MPTWQRVGHASPYHRICSNLVSLYLIDSKLKKRKPSELSTKPQPPQKKQALSNSAMTVKAVVIKDIKDKAKPIVSVTAVKDAKSDSSFFSTPKPKPKLPSFKKAPVPMPVKKEENVAQPSSVDPFQEVLKTMKTRRESPATSTPPPVYTAPQTNSLSKYGKKKKSVTWAPDSQLESVRLIERAVYDDDPQEVCLFISPKPRALNSDSAFLRVRFSPIAYANWIGVKVRLSMRRYLRRLLTGWNPRVSEPYINRIRTLM